MKFGTASTMVRKVPATNHDTSQYAESTAALVLSTPQGTNTDDYVTREKPQTAKKSRNPLYAESSATLVLSSLQKTEPPEYASPEKNMVRQANC